VGGAPGDLEPHREHALRLDPDVHVGGLAGDHEVAHEPLADELIAAALALLLRLLVRHDAEADAHVRRIADVVQREEHRRQRPLHVVRAATEQPLAVRARLELAGATRDDVEMAVQQHCGGLRGAGLGDRDRQPLDVDLARLDVARLQPPLDEAGGEADPLWLRGVVRDQLLGQRALVHALYRLSATSRKVSARALSRSASW
jgi:hypothetical protein